MEVVIVSVIMTAYNREKQIGRAIESIIKGIYTDLELIVVDEEVQILLCTVFTFVLL